MEIVVTSQVIPASGTILQTKTGGRSAYEIENLKMFEPTKLRTTSHHWAFSTTLQQPIRPLGCPCRGQGAESPRRAATQGAGWFHRRYNMDVGWISNMGTSYGNSCQMLLSEYIDHCGNINIDLGNFKHISLTWIKAIWGSFPLLTMIPQIDGMTVDEPAGDDLSSSLISGTEVTPHFLCMAYRHTRGCAPSFLCFVNLV